MQLLIVGSAAYDTVEAATGKVEEALGGSAIYSAVAASFFCPPAVVAVVGEDFRDEHLEFLSSRGIDLSGLQKKPGRTFRWSGRYLPDMIGRETLDTQLNVFADFDPILPEAYRELRYLFLANIHPRLQKKVLEQVREPELVVLDTMNLWINTAREELLALLPQVDLLVVNDEEARLLTGRHNLLKAAKLLLGQGVKRAVLVKRGEHGSTLVTREGLALLPAYPVEDLVDPTGAGDSFAGALIGFLASRQDLSLSALKQALLHAAALASFTVEDFSLERLKRVTTHDLAQRVKGLKELMRVD